MLALVMIRLPLANAGQAGRSGAADRDHVTIVLKGLLLKFVSFVAYALCAYWVLRDPPGYGPYGLSGSEFSGGSLTGPLLNLNFAGFFLLAGAVVLAFVFPRISAIAAILACLLCLPLRLYFVIPRAFYWSFPWLNWSDLSRLPPYLVPDKWAIESLVTFTLVISLCIYILRNAKDKNIAGSARPKPDVRTSSI